jgi:hypothetical protein
LVCEKYAFSEKQQPHHRPQGTRKVHMSKDSSFFLKSLSNISGADREKQLMSKEWAHIVEVFTQKEK